MGAENEKQLNVRSHNNWLGSSEKKKKQTDFSCSLHWLSNRNAVTNYWCSRDLQEEESFQVRHYPCKRVEKQQSLSQFPPSLPFPYLLLQDILALQDNGKKKSKPSGNPEVHLSFSKNLDSSSMLYYIRYSIMQFPSLIHKTSPQNLAALHKICLWLLFLEVLMKTRGLIDSIAEEL